MAFLLRGIPDPTISAVDRPNARRRVRMTSLPPRGRPHPGASDGSPRTVSGRAQARRPDASLRVRWAGFESLGEAGVPEAGPVLDVEPVEVGRLGPLGPFERSGRQGTRTASSTASRSASGTASTVPERSTLSQLNVVTAQ